MTRSIAASTRYGTVSAVEFTVPKRFRTACFISRNDNIGDRYERATMAIRAGNPRRGKWTFDGRASARASGGVGSDHQDALPVPVWHVGDAYRRRPLERERPRRRGLSRQSRADVHQGLHLGGAARAPR